MTGLAIIRSARAAGVDLKLTAAGKIKASGPREAVARWAPAVKANKAEIVTALSDPGPDRVEDWEERAAILEFEAGLPRSWAEPFARLLCGGPPGDFDERRWRRVVDGALKFADQWSAEAVAAGWGPDDVFGLHPTAPCARDQYKGLAWLLSGGAKVVAIDADGADIVTASGAPQRFYRRKDG